MNSPVLYRSVWLLVILVLACGIVIPPLMDYDAAQIGTISMTMYQRNDWLTLLNRHYVGGAWYDYLDKPHMVYWSAIAGYKIFGLNHVGTRFFSVLSTLLAAYGTMRLGAHLYSRQVGAWAALIFITSQAIMLANHDVRTDSLLTSFTLLAIWQLVLFIDTRKWLPLMAGFIFLAFGVGTKGLISAVVAGFVLLFYLLGKKDWQGIFNWKWPIGIFFFLLGLSPFLYAYYLQFDMHPEKLVNGTYGNSGVKFLLWSHSMDRFTGNRNLVASPEFSFFFHTILWAFLPWTIFLVSGVYGRIKELFRTRFESQYDREQLTFIGVWVVFLLMSLSHFKLPHYLNILFPLFAIFSAAWLEGLSGGGEAGLQRLMKAQQFLAGIMLVLAAILSVWFFPLTNIWVVVGLAPFVFVLVRLWRSGTGIGTPDRIILLTATAALLVNFVLNTHFYRELGRYQAGNTMAALIRSKGIDSSSVYLYGKVMRSFDFYTRRITPVLDSAGIVRELVKGRSLYFFTTDNSGDTLRMQFPQAREVLVTPNQKITRLKLSFLNPATRERGLPVAKLYELTPAGLSAGAGSAGR